MNLPIDARTAPFREKYIDEETPLFYRWFRFYLPDTDGTVSLTDRNSENVFEGLSVEQADAIEKARDEFVQKVIDILNQKHDDTH